MPPLALALLLLSATFHMGWNLLVKQATDRHVLTWWALVCGGLFFLPLPIFFWQGLSGVWGYALASAVFQLAYYLILGYAYNRGDFSLVYPVARGSAPIFIALWSVLFLGEQVTGLGVAGLATIVAGLIVIGVGAWQSSRDRTVQGLASLVAPLAIALSISGYSVIDGAAVKQTSPLPYTVLCFWLNALLLAPVIILRYGLSPMRTVLQQNWRRISLVGILTYAAYGLVLAAYALAQVSYVGAVREVSIVFAALVGWLWLGERFGLPRTIGALVVCAGIILVTVAG
jgi:drug/metabolite transporter (DMT)-like permease